MSGENVDVLGETEASGPSGSSSSTDSDALPTRVGKYRISGKLGEGGMGVVLSGRDEDLHRDVAIKIVRTDDGSGDLLMREARALARLSHPNVVTVHEVGRSQNGVYVAMELVRGSTLDEWFADHPDWRERAAMLAQAARGLEAAHEAGLVHRDFKPANVIVGDDGRARVVDFGLAVAGEHAVEVEVPDDLVDLERFTRTGTIVGTPLYMAPEQWLGVETDARTDQFAFCAVAFEALLGGRPFSGDSAISLRDSVLLGDIVDRPAGLVPAEIIEALLTGLATDADERHPDMGPLIEALTLDEPERESRLPWIASAVIAALAVAITVVFVLSGSDLEILEPVVAADLRAAMLESSQLPPPLDEALPDDPMGVTVHRLHNGLTVYLSPSRDAPTISAAMVFRAGGRHDPPELPGLAHVVEHLTTRGTDRIGTVDRDAERAPLDQLRGLSDQLVEAAPAEREALWTAINQATAEAARYEVRDDLERALEELGATGVAAETNHDATVYTATFPSNRLSTWLELEAERWTAPVFRGYYPELDKLLDELRRDLPERHVRAPLLRLLYGDHPYARDPAGDPAKIDRITIDDAESFFERWYVPNNAALILAGDLERDPTLAVIEQAFAEWEPRPLPQAPISGTPTPPSRTTESIEYAGPTRAVVSWRAPPLVHADAPAFAALERLLDNRTAGLLTSALDGVAELDSVDAELTGRVDGGWFSVSATALPGVAPERVAAAINAALEKVRSGDVDPELLAAIDAQETVFALRRARRPEIRIHALRDAFVQRVPWQQAVAARARAIDRQTLTSLAERYLREPLALLATSGEPRYPTIDSLPLEPLAHAAPVHSGWVAELLDRPVVPLEPRFLAEGRDYWRAATARGALIAVPNRTDAIFRLAYRWSVGRVEIPLVCAALDAYQNAAPRSPAVARRRRQWLSYGMYVVARCDAQTVVVELYGNDAHFADSVAALDELLAGEGAGDEAVSARLAEYTRRAIDDAKTTTSVVAGAQWLAGLGPTTPRLARLPRALASATPEKLRAALAELAMIKPVILYYGPRSSDEVVTIAGEARATRTVTRAPVRFLRPARPRIVAVDDPRLPAAFVSVAVPLERPEPENVVVHELLGVILNESDNPILAHLRAEAGIATGAVSGLEIPGDAGDDAFVYTQLRTAPAGAATAVLEALEALETLSIEPARVTEALRALEARYRTDWISELDVADAVLRWARSGLTEDPRPARYGQLPDMTLGDLAPVITTIRETPPIITIVGDTSALDLAALRAAGDLTMVDAEDVYRRR